MPIETLDDIISNLADALGIYGVHDEERVTTDRCACRLCFESVLKSRILAAVTVETKLGRL